MFILVGMYQILLKFQYGLKICLVSDKHNYLLISPIIQTDFFLKLIIFKQTCQGRITFN